PSRDQHQPRAVFQLGRVVRRRHLRRGARLVHRHASGDRSRRRRRSAPYRHPAGRVDLSDAEASVQATGSENRKPTELKSLQLVTSRPSSAWPAYAVFFLSGLASLMDEVVWFKYLHLTLGSTTSAAATLLAVFMGGLALGSWIFLCVAPRLSRPALAYGVLEAGVGVFALATPMLFAAVERGYVFAFRHVGEGPGVLLLVRAALATAALLPPTILM